MVLLQNWLPDRSKFLLSVAVYEKKKYANTLLELSPLEKGDDTATTLELRSRGAAIHF